MHRSLHETLTQLLMDNGAAVTKKSVDELIKWIGERDSELFSEQIRMIEGFKRTSQEQTAIK